VAASFAGGASDGITISAGMPKSFAASATACAWFPEEKATAPARFCAALKRLKAL